MKKFRNISLLTVILFTLVLVLSGCSSQTSNSSNQEKKPKYVIKFNHVLAESEPYHQGFLNWAQRVKERTNGDVEIQVFHSSQLGKEEDIIEQLRQGGNVAQNTDAARLAMYIPAMAVLNAPYFVDSIEEVEKLKELPTVKKWLEELENKYGIKVISFNWVQGLRHMVTNKPIITPNDLKGLRIRTPGAPIWQESVRALGATPVAMAFGDVYVGIQQGAIDGAELVYRNVTGGKLYEIAKYISETKHILLINFEVMSKKYFDSLPKEYQQILIEECDKAGLETSKFMEEDVEKIKAELKEKGVKIIEDVNVEEFRKVAEDAYKKLNLVGIRDQIYKEIGKK